jgi:hypothetical protein
MTAGSLANIYTELRLYFLPMIFKSFGEVDYVRKHLDAPLIAGLEKEGFVTFGFAEGGFAYVMSKSPVRSNDDLRNQKVWMPNSHAATLEVMETLGIKPIPLPIADVRTSLQTGLIDAVTVSPIGAIVLQWHTQVKYLTDMPDMDHKNRKNNVEALRVLGNHGIQFVKLDSETENQWHQVASAVAERLIEVGGVSRHMMDLLDGHLRDYRSQLAKSDG